ncbi:type IV pilus assembly protein PilM [Phytohalomonas tamaricis]|uniref:type IV pilus assembly protein PilM n=1 Tax=Phytohalomonas tamaricis TaxID=2081032 RepID=UPI000D0BA9B2|nr:type IV pilus assembly protein PilM [Phytohalomonas tamaricis]
MFGLKTSSTGLIGVDITSATVKLLELVRQGEQFRVESYAVRPLQENAVVERRIRDMDEVVTALTRAVEKARPKSRRAVVALPATAVITKTISLPYSYSDEEIEARIALDSDKHIPFPFNEVTFDFQRLGVNPRYADQQDVLLVACRLQDVQLLTDALTQAGLVPAAVDVETFAMERAYRELLRADGQARQERAQAVVDVGASMTAFHVISGGRIVHSRDSVMGGRQLTDEIRQTYRLTLDEAGLAKKLNNLPDYEARLLHPFREALVQQVMRSLQLYYTTAGSHDIDRIMLAGGSSVITGLQARLAEESGLEVVSANPFMHMRLNARIELEALNRDAPAMLTACGLAMRSMS